MTDPQLFATPPPLDISSGEADRLAARRRAARQRQRRCRALKKWRAQMIDAPVEQQARIEERRRAIEQVKAKWTMEQTMQWYRGQNVVLGALRFGGEPARRALELVEPRAIFDERFIAVWEAMKALHQRRAIINARTVSAQLRRTGVLVLLDLAWLESGTMPRPTVAEVETYAAFLNAVAKAEPRASLAAAA